MVSSIATAVAIITFTVLVPAFLGAYLAALLSPDDYERDLKEYDDWENLR